MIFKLILFFWIYIIFNWFKDEDYDLDDEKTENKPELTFLQKVALNRDWFGRENPNTYPTHGFFPVWPLLLITIAGI